MRTNKVFGRAFLAVSLALAPLLWATPAFADWNVGIGNLQGSCVQFDWRGGTATYSGSGDGVFTVDVNNLSDNRIGGGSQADSWSIYVNNQLVVQSNIIEQSQVSVTVAGDWVVTVQGIDVGFWAGWYGPQFCNPTFSGDVVAVEPTPVYTPAALPTGDYRLDEGWGAHVVAPAGMVIDYVTAWYGDPNDGNNGADWSAQYTEQLHGLAEADLNSGNYFGDPVPGVYKVLIATVFFMADPSADVRPVVEPIVEPTVQPSVEPSVTPEPTVSPTPDVVPSSEPTSTPDPIPAPVVEPTPAPAPEPVVVPPTVVIDPAPVDVRPSEPPVTEVTPDPVPVAPEPVASPSIEPPVETPPAVVDPLPTTAPETPDVPVQTDPSPTPTESATPDPTPSEPAPVEATPTPTPKPTPVAQQSSTPKAEASVAPIVVAPKPEAPQQVSETSLPSVPDNATPAQIAEAITAANEVLDMAAPDSPAYQEALNVLAEAAAADDPEVPAEVADVPFVGPAAVAVLQAFNALGNLGADISPAIRKKMKKVGTAVIVMGIAGSSTVSIRRK